MGIRCGELKSPSALNKIIRINIKSYVPYLIPNS